MIRWSTLLMTMFLVCRAWAAGVVLRELNPKDDELLRKQLPALFQPGVDQATLDDAIRLLVERGTYENVFVEKRADGGYDIIGKPVRTVEAIELRGVSNVEEKELRDLIDYKTGERFDRKRAVAAGEKMKQFYGEAGYFNTVIEVSFDKMPSKNIKVVYAIQEKEPCLITGLEFQTANVDLKARLESRFRNLRRRKLTTDRARRLINDLNEFLVNERYLAAEVLGPDASYNPEKTRAQLKFEIREPYRWEFYFSGFKFMTQADLWRAMDLHNRERKNVEPAPEGAERMRRAYLEKGFPNVQIDTKVVNPPGTYLRRVYYTITENPRVRLKAIEVSGRISRASSYYQDFIIQNSSPLIAKGYYNRADLESGFKNLVTDLRNQGFLRARVLSTRTEFNDKRDAVTVNLLLEEGPQTQIRALDFEGNKFISSFELMQVTGLDTNTALHLNAFEEAIEKLKSFYQDQGFLEMKLLNEHDDIITYNEKGTQARILFRIYEGPRIRINTIHVEGNTITQTRVILKEADLHDGELLTPAKLEEATARLNRLGLFSRVDIHTLEEGTNVAQRTLVITVADRDPGVFRLGAGVTNERNFTLRGFSGISYSNLAGSGRGISLRGETKYNVSQINYPEHEITAGYLEPFLFNTRTRGRVNLTRSEYVFNYIAENVDRGTPQITQLTTTNRLDLLAERDLTLHTKLTWKLWGLESNTDWERHGYCSQVDKDGYVLAGQGKCPEDTLQVGTFGPTLDIDYRDSAFLPTRGSFTRFVVDYADPVLGSSKSVRFVRTEGNYTYHLPLPLKRWVWSNSARAGYVKNLAGEAGGVPANYAFFLGGIYTVRGYDLSSNNERIPFNGDDGLNVTKGNQLVVPGESNYYLLKSEVRFPIWNEHGGVVFYDGGQVDIQGYHFTRRWNDAVGFGYRYNTPVGPLALDFAFKLHPVNDQSTFRFHLSIGTF